MTEYYLDVETTGLDPQQDRVTGICWAQMDLPSAGPNAYTWGDCPDFVEDDPEVWLLKKAEVGTWMLKPGWDFVPVGYNVNFDLVFLHTRAHSFEPPLTKYSLGYLLLNKPRIDLYPIVVMLNGGQFRGTKLSDWSTKIGGGHDAPTLAHNQEWDQLKEYMLQEYWGFQELYGTLRGRLGDLGLEIRRELANRRRSLQEARGHG